MSPCLNTLLIDSDSPLIKASFTVAASFRVSLTCDTDGVYGTLTSEMIRSPDDIKEDTEKEELTWFICWWNEDTVSTGRIVYVLPTYISMPFSHLVSNSQQNTTASSVDSQCWLSDY